MGHNKLPKWAKITCQTHQEEEAARRRETEQKKILEEVEAVFRGQGPLQREATLKRWRYLAGREAPNIDNARALWEHDQWDPDAKAWRETCKTIEWETNQVVKSAQAIEEWRRKHPVQSLALRTGLKQPPANLRRLEQTHAESIRFLEGSQRRLEEIEQAWPKKRLIYKQQLEREGEEIVKAKRCLGVIEQHHEHFQKFWHREDRLLNQKRQQQTRGREHGGWSR